MTNVIFLIVIMQIIIEPSVIYSNSTLI